MRIEKVRLNCRTGTAVTTDAQLYSLYVFRSPVMISAEGTERRYPAGYAVIFTDEQEAKLRPAENGLFRYETVAFRPSSADKQYAASMNVPFGKPVPVPDKALISNTLRTMKARENNKGKYSLEMLEISMRMIIISLYAELISDEPPKEEQLPKLPQLTELRNSIYADPLRKWDIDRICRDLCISRTYFHRLYHTAFGVTCLQDVIESRMMYAADLLANTDMSVGSIADKCGYENASYFMRQFRLRRGCTPSEYRKRLHEGQEPAVQGENLLKTLKKRFT